MDSVKQGNVKLLEDERIDSVNEDLRLIQKKTGLTYGTDAFLLAAYVRPVPSAKAVELGGGTGIVSLLLAAKRKVAQVTALEVQPSFAHLIDRNAALNSLSGRVRALCADVREATAEALGGEVDLVFSNPPYMRCDSGKRNETDEKFIARHEVCGGIEDFCSCAARLLKHGGRFVCVWRPDRLTDLFDALRRARLEPKRMTMVHADEGSEPCMVLVEALKGGAPAMRVTPPLLLYKKENPKAVRVMTPETEGIYRDCDFSGFYPLK